MDNTTHSTETAVTTPEIFRELDALEFEIEYLRGRIAILGDRLDPILSKIGEEGGSSEECADRWSPSTAVGARLHGATSRITGMATRVNTLLAELGI